MVVHKNSVVCVNKAGLVANSPICHVFLVCRKPSQVSFPPRQLSLFYHRHIVTIQIQIHYDVQICQYILQMYIMVRGYIIIDY